jgi:polyphosphate kinase
LRSVSTAADVLSLDDSETRRRELLRERVARRRAGQPRRLKTLDATVHRLMAVALRMRSSLAGRDVASSEAVLALAERGKAPT